jgi:putative chitinase
MTTTHRFDRDIYFDAVRSNLFGGALEQVQVDGQNVILAVWEYEATGSPMTDLRWLAYCLATPYWETGQTMWPNTEQGSDSYLQGKEYWPYIGRGLVHLTWEDNYRFASSALSLVGDRDLVAHPELALDSLIASRIMFRGMAEGWFTGRKLGQYFNEEKDDPLNARQIINGNDQDEKIAGFHYEFLDALQASLIEVEPEPMLGPTQIDIRTAPGQRVTIALDGEVVVG